MYLIVGLGNPGPKYAKTRHNVGFMVIEKLGGRWDINVDKGKFEGVSGSGQIKGEPVMLLKPLTYMNRSGLSVRAAMDFYKLEPKDLLMILDDLALPVGQIRIRHQGSAGGHNGLSDVIRHAGTDQIARVRVGIGSPPPRMDSADYVLGEFRSDEKPVMAEMIEQAADAVETIVDQGITRAMDRFNRTPKPAESRNDQES
ncbi:MAG: aminoacyl-tRNA hydrolase [Phycisphaerae bacterium]|jgi:PTH1 family peptidyl-tRNA hydrolase|nr:aminoacyl-tRNA hydrolase [Phycisphaerae bacterium]